MFGFGYKPPTREEFEQHLADADLRVRDPGAYSKEMKRREEEEKKGP